MSEQQENPSWKTHARRIRIELGPVIDFAVHIFVGTTVFILIAMAAVVLDFALKKLENHEISAFILIGLEIATIALFVTDMFLFLVFLVKAGRRLFHNLDWKAKNERNNNT